MKKIISQGWLFVIAMILIILQSTSSIAQTRLSDNESRFYTDLIPNNTTDVILSGANSASDSQTLQSTIDSVSAQGGGIITINNNSSGSTGFYYILDVELKSNIHLKIASDVELIARSNGKMFYIGENTYVENVAITNVDIDNTDPSTWAKINLAQGLDFSKNWSFLKIANANNFKVSGFRIEDNHSRISGITMGADATGSKSNIPNKGVVKDIVMSVSHVGFGIAQVQASKTVLFKNLDGTGGTTLRLESGLGILNNDTVLTLDDVVGRDIICRNGDGAVVLSPHRLNQGVVDVDRLYSYSSTFAVSVASGFLDNTGSGTNLGVFDEASYIGDIYVFGGNFSQVKSKNFNFYDCTTRQALVDRCGKSLKKPSLDIEAYPAQSISVIKDIANSSNGCSGGSANGCYDVTFGGTITKGNSDFVFPSQNTIDNSDKISGSCSLTVRANCAQPYPVAAYTTSSVGNSVTFDASGSSDDGSIVEYQWIFGDGTVGYGQNVTHNYTQSGGYSVTLSVRDNNHAVTTTLETISVSGTPPNQDPQSAFTFTVTDLSADFDASTSADSDGTIASYAWDFGDGNTANSSTTSHVYTTAGTFTVVLTVTDNDGATNSSSQDVMVTNPNQVPQSAFTFTVADLSVDFDGSTSADSDGTIASYAWDFGDGNTDTVATPSHTYITSGTYSVELTVTDNESATNSSTQNISVNITIGCTASGSILMERFDGIGGKTINELLSSSNYPNNPSVTQELNSFEIPSNVKNNYGVRVRGVLCAPETGLYYFWIAGDDNVQLNLSLDDTETNVQLIAFHDNKTNIRDWNKFSTQKSIGINLVAGESYYIEAFMKEGKGRDHLAVGWRKPSDGNGSSPAEVIPGNVLSPITAPSSKFSSGKKEESSQDLTLETINHDITFRMSPNPAINYVNVEIYNLPSESQVKYMIYNIQGQKVLSRNGGAKKRIDLSGLSSGAYILVLQSKKIRMRKSLIVK